MTPQTDKLDALKIALEMLPVQFETAHPEAYPSKAPTREEATAYALGCLETKQKALRALAAFMPEAPTPEDVTFVRVLWWLATKTAALDLTLTAAQVGNMQAAVAAGAAGMKVGPGLEEIARWLNDRQTPQRFPVSTVTAEDAEAVAWDALAAIRRRAHAPVIEERAPEARTIKSAWGFPLNAPPPAEFPPGAQPDVFAAMLKEMHETKYRGYAFPVLMHPAWFERFPELAHWPLLAQRMPLTQEGPQ